MQKKGENSFFSQTVRTRLPRESQSNSCTFGNSTRPGSCRGKSAESLHVHASQDSAELMSAAQHKAAELVQHSPIEIILSANTRPRFLVTLDDGGEISLGETSIAIDVYTTPGAVRPGRSLPDQQTSRAILQEDKGYWMRFNTPTNAPGSKNIISTYSRKLASSIP